jgi:hypothetical protein
MDTKSTNTNQAAPPGKDSPRSCAAAGSAPKYEIKTVQDFLKVPEDRLEECLKEFRDYLDIARSVSKLVKATGELLGAKGTEAEVGCFNWCDDGIRKGTLRLETKVEQNDKLCHGVAERKQ